MRNIMPCLAVFMFAFAPCVARAQETDMDKVRATLAGVAGEFKATATIGTDKNPGRRTAKWNIGKSCLVAEEVYEDASTEEGKFSVNILEGWDPSSRTVKQVMFSSDGANSTTLFKVVGDRLIGLRSGIDVDGTRWTANVEVKPVGDKGFDLQIDNYRTDNGDERPDIHVEFRRK